MSNFLSDLSTNLALQVFVLTACHFCNRLMPGTSLNGLHIFVALALAAFLLDAALTFLVFADSRNRYGQFSSTIAFVERACAYWLPIMAALAWRRIGRSPRPTKVNSSKTLVIHTSPYSKSNLPM